HVQTAVPEPCHGRFGHYDPTFSRQNGRDHGRNGRVPPLSRLVTSGVRPQTCPEWANDRSPGAGARKRQGMHDVDGLNAGYATALLEEYLENPDAVPEEWRRLFESGDSELVTTHPGLARLLEALREDGNGHHAALVVSPAAPAPVAPPQPVRL